MRSITQCTKKVQKKFYEVRKTIDSTKIVHYNANKDIRISYTTKGGGIHETYKIFTR